MERRKPRDEIEDIASRKDLTKPRTKSVNLVSKYTSRPSLRKAMNMNCAAIADALAGLSEGLPEPTAQEHVESCAKCAAKLEQLRTMVSLAKVAHYDAPEELIQSAKNLMHPQRRGVVAVLLRSSLASSGARTLPDAAHLLVGDSEIAIRLMIRRQGEGYEILGELPSSDWKVDSQLGTLTQNGVRFEMMSESPEATAFVAETDAIRLEVPSVEELLTRGTCRAG